MDHCCTGASLCSEAEYRRYCRATGNKYSIAPHSSASVKFGNSNGSSNAGRLRSIGKAVIRGKIQLIERDISGMPVIKWDYAATCLLTDVELRRLHRGFGHRSVDTIMRALDAADFEGWNQACDKSDMTLLQVVILVRGMQLVRGTFPSRVATAVTSIFSSKQMSWKGSSCCLLIIKAYFAQMASRGL
jgi:hypothetical protein